MNANKEKRKPSKDAPVDFVTLLGEELAEISKLREKREWRDRDTANAPKSALGRDTAEIISLPGSPVAERTPDKLFENAHQQALVGLSFSGGGIRSATFNLGILQGFANLGLLPMFDYLSTVSGGGYIGSWLETWIYRAGKNAEVARCDANSEIDNNSSPIRRVQKCLQTDRSSKPEHGEPRAIRFLREYSNYLTPRLGFLGADTWTAVAIYLRNLLLNQTILVLFLFFLLLLPHMTVWFSLKITSLQGHWGLFVLPLVALVLILKAQWGVSTNMGHLTGVGPTGEFPPIARQGPVLALVAGPLFISAWFLSLWLWSEESWNWPLLVWLIFGVVGFSLTWTVAALRGLGEADAVAAQWNSWRVTFASIGLSLVSGSAGGILLWAFVNRILKRWFSVDGSIWHVVSFGTPMVVLIFLLVGTLQLGLMGRLFPDPRREWWGRLGGWLLILAFTWAAAFALTIYSPLGLIWAKRWASAAGLIWVFNTAIGVLGGKSSKTGSSEPPSWIDKVLSVTPYVCIIGLGAVLATVLEVGLAVLNGPPISDAVLDRFLTGSPMTQKVAGWIISLDWTWGPEASSHQQGTLNLNSVTVNNAKDYMWAHWDLLGGITNYKLIIPLSAAAVLCLLLARRVDLNEFSMNLFYRNRLVRCYLGASHKFRNPNPFTGFDPSDDACVSDLRSDNCYSGPFPIVNTTLNLVKGQNLAWQERKAESFVITPLRCGFDTWLERLDLQDESAQVNSKKIRKYGFRPAANYAYPGGFRLGTAVSISGAAASPNMGYHSSPALAFLMTFFNVRLGFWAGNPRRDATWKLPGPRFGLFHLLSELFGQTDDEASYVYLSDGGHFENLGLYELVKRRCKFVIVSDADCDEGYAFGDLGNAIRKCREDIGVEIELQTGEVTPKTSGNNSFSTRHWAVGKIHYNLLDPNAADGILIYIKASLTEDEPADVLNYHRQHPDFPHQTTGDQWFTESQFESYRRLGEHIVEKLFSEVHVAGRNTEDIFKSVESKYFVSPA